MKMMSWLMKRVVKIPSMKYHVKLLFWCIIAFGLPIVLIYFNYQLISDGYSRNDLRIWRLSRNGSYHQATSINRLRVMRVLAVNRTTLIVGNKNGNSNAIEIKRRGMKRGYEKQENFLSRRNKERSDVRSDIMQTLVTQLSNIHNNTIVNSFENTFINIGMIPNAIQKQKSMKLSNSFNAIPNENLTLTQVYQNIIRWSFIGREDNSIDHLLNLHRFSFSLNSKICRHSPDVLVFVQSAIDHFAHRTRIRETWGSTHNVRGVSFRTVFMVGQSDNFSVQTFLRNESAIHGDIVQGNFKDTYRNLTYKHVMTLGWILENCPQIQFIVKVDDDIILNIFNLERYIRSMASTHSLLCCSVFIRPEPKRGTTDKWYVSVRTYPFNFYPSYCEGFGYIMSPDVAKTLYKASEDTRFYWVDDVYVTGILTLKVGFRLSQLPAGHSYNRNGGRAGTLKHVLFISAAAKNWHHLWSMTLRARPQ